ncbi:MAG: DUF998 domain-containing protein [Acidiferrobacterales bacterium]|nr:DUF998 domain-containing protein [Acidiferrobacterales bacterium]
MNKTRSRMGAALATMLGVATFVVVVIILHLLQPGYEPRYQLMSELALGPNGWAMLVAFSGLAIAILGLQAAIAKSGGSLGYRVLLLAVAMLVLAAGIFPLGAATLIHISAIAAAFVLSVLAMYLYPKNAGQASAAGPRALSWPLAAGMAVSVAAGHAVVPMGIGQRLAAACLIAWLAIVGWKLYRL